MRKRHKQTLDELFREPTPSGIAWREVEGLLRALGAEVSEGRGSRVRVSLNGVRAVFHRPHPAKELGRGMVRSVRAFLSSAGVR